MKYICHCEEPQGLRQPRPATRYVRLDCFASLAMTLLMTACAVGPDYFRPSAPVPIAFKEASPMKDFIGPMKAPPAPLPANFIGPVQPKPLELLAPAKPQDEAIRGKWWEVFNDAELNKLEEQVAQSNQTVKASEAAYHQARALAAQARAGFFPVVSADVGMSRSANNSIGAGVHNSYTATGEVSWVPDFWGQVRRQFEESKANAQAGAANLASATLVAQGEMAVDYLNLRIADEQKRLLTRSAADFARSLQITQNQYKVGIVSSSDVLQAKVQLQSTQAQAADIGVARAQYEHAMAVLIGKAPADFSMSEVDNVPALPPMPEAVPAQLLQRRPDIAAAERTVAAANAQIGVMEGAFFPNITLSASGGYASSQLAQWFMLPNRFWSIGPELVQTIFDAGLRAAQTEAAIAAYDQTVANYRQTVLVAFQGVEDNFAGLRILAHEQEVLDAAAKDAHTATVVFLNQYKAGTVSYLNVVTAQTSELNNELAALNVRRARLVAAATLIENLGGGWDAKVLEKPEVTTAETSVLSVLPPRVDHSSWWPF